MHANVMEQENVLITSVPLTMVINSSSFLRTFTQKELEHKMEHQETQATFLDLET